MADVASPSNLDFFCGVWKRCLHRRTLTHMRVDKDVSTLVVIDRMPEEMLAQAHAAGSHGSRKSVIRYRWSFGKNMESVRLGFTVDTHTHSHTHMHTHTHTSSLARGGLTPLAHGHSLSHSLDRSSSSVAHSAPVDGVEVIPLRVLYGGRECYGAYVCESTCMTLHLLSPAASATCVYKVLDDDTLAVTITEIPGHAAGAAGAGVVECGYMFRVRS